MPTKPRTGDRNVWTAVVLVFVSECAAWIQSFMTTMTPRLFAAGSTATPIAL